MHNVPYCAKKIARKFNQEKIYVENDTYNVIPIESTTIDENQFSIALFIDGNTTETSTCGTGPNGDYVGSTRKK